MLHMGGNAHSSSVASVCAPVVYQLSPGSSTGITMTSSPLAVIVSNMNAIADYTFIIEAQKGDSTWFSGSQYVIRVECSGEVITDPNTPVSPLILATLSVGSSSNTVILSSFTTVPAACAPIAYRLSTGSSSGITFSSMVLTVTNMNVRANYTVIIEAQKISDSSWFSGSQYTIRVECKDEYLSDINYPTSPSIFATLQNGKT